MTTIRQLREYYRAGHRIAELEHMVANRQAAVTAATAKRDLILREIRAATMTIPESESREYYLEQLSSDLRMAENSIVICLGQMDHEMQRLASAREEADARMTPTSNSTEHP